MSFLSTAVINRHYQYRPQSEQCWWLSNKSLDRRTEYDYYGPKIYYQKINNWIKARDNALWLEQTYPEKKFYYPESPFKKSVSVLGSIRYMHKVAVNASQNILKYLLFMYKYLKRHSLHIYKILVTGENCQISYNKDKPYYLTVGGRNPYPNIKKAWTNARRNFNKPTVFHILLNNIESTLGENLSLNVHSHALGVSSFSLTDNQKRKIAKRIQTSFANQHEDVSVTVKPAYISKQNRSDMVLTAPVPPVSVLKRNSYTNDAHTSAWQGLVNLIHYMLKQFIMPVVKDSTDLQRYLKVSHYDGFIITHAIMNSASTIKSRYFYQSAKRGKKSIKSYAEKLGQQSCLDLKTVDDDPEVAYYASSAFNGTQHHHYTYKQNIRRAYHIQDIQIAFTWAIYRRITKQVAVIRYNRFVLIIHTFEAISAEKQQTQKDSISIEANRAKSESKPTNDITTVTASRIINHSGIPP